MPTNLTLLNVSDDGQSTSHSGRLADLRILVYDGQTIPFPDGHFDVLICNSVLEHVPVHQRAPLCEEIRRVARYHFVQTPAFAFPIEPHFVFPGLQWLPRRLGVRLARYGLWAILTKPPETRIVSYFEEVRLLRRRDLAALLPGSWISTERLLGLPKSYTAHGPGTSTPTSLTQRANRLATG